MIRHGVIYREENLKIIIQQDWIVLARRDQFHRKINNALPMLYTKYHRYFQNNEFYYEKFQILYAHKPHLYNNFCEPNM